MEYIVSEMFCRIKSSSEWNIFYQCWHRYLFKIKHNNTTILECIVPERVWELKSRLQWTYFGKIYVDIGLRSSTTLWQYFSALCQNCFVELSPVLNKTHINKCHADISIRSIITHAALHQYWSTLCQNCFFRTKSSLE